MANRKAQPTHNVVFPKPDPNDPSQRVFIQVGVAWVDEERIRVKLDAIPLGFDGVLELYSKNRGQS